MGNFFSLVLDYNNEVWGFGDNSAGQLALENSTFTVSSPTKSIRLKDITNISCGKKSSVFLDIEGKVFLSGSNSNGQLARPIAQVIASNLLPCENIPPIKKIASGEFHVLLLTINGEVIGFGGNFQGQTGIKTLHGKNVDFPTKIDFDVVIEHISCGTSHSMFIDCEGFLWTCGLNGNGQLGFGDLRGRSFPQKLDSIKHITSISSGGNATIAKDYNGQVWVFGWNICGQLGVGDREDRLSPAPLPDEYYGIVGEKHAPKKSARK